MQHIERVHKGNYGVFGARKVCLMLKREGIEVARCAVERLMRRLGLRGVVRGRRVRTTVPDANAARPTDPVQRQFTVSAPHRLWVADFTYVATWAGMVYVALIIDAYARRILGWRADTTMRTSMSSTRWRRSRRRPVRRVGRDAYDNAWPSRPSVCTRPS